MIKTKPLPPLGRVEKSPCFILHRCRHCHSTQSRKGFLGLFGFGEKICDNIECRISFPNDNLPDIINTIPMPKVKQPRREARKNYNPPPPWVTIPHPPPGPSFK